ncbi:hypothetical protein [Bradyrhizobium sp. DASA03007]|uniref:hypothetical protein n=1 Tax=unclassified Bradyrhizobium TaxID=2631580 RepID=UPI003F6F133F
MRASEPRFLIKLKVSGANSMGLFLSAPPLITAAPTGYASATVTYKTDVFLKIRERIVGQPWRPVGLDGSGNHPITLKAGQKYEAEAFDARDVDPVSWPNYPNDPRRVDPKDQIAVRAIAGTGPLLREPATPDVGGTYAFFRVATGTVASFAVVQIGKTPPVADASGFQTMANAEQTLESEGLTVHEFEVAPLVPTSSFNYLVTILDVGTPTSTGTWQQVSGTFTTKQRVATIILSKLVITDDSDPNSVAGPGRFAFQIRESGKPQPTVVKDWQFTISSFTDKAPNNQIDLSPYGLATVLGPKPLTADTDGIGIALRCVEEDASAFWDTDDIAETPYGTAVWLDIPTGRFKENVSTTQKIQALPRTSADLLKFHVHVDYTIAYV